MFQIEDIPQVAVQQTAAVQHLYRRGEQDRDQRRDGRSNDPQLHEQEIIQPEIADQGND